MQSSNSSSSPLSSPPDSSQPPPPISRPPPPVMATSPPASSPPPSSNAPPPFSPVSPPPSSSTPPPPPVVDSPPPSSHPPPPPSPATVTPPPPSNPERPTPPPSTPAPPPPNTPESSPPPPLPSPSPLFAPPSNPAEPTTPSPPPPPDSPQPSTSTPPPPIRNSPSPPSLVLTPPSSPPSPESEDIGTSGKVIIAAAIALFLIAVSVTVAFCIRNRKRKRSGAHGGDYIVPTTETSSIDSGSYILKMHNFSSPSTGNGYSTYELGGLSNSRLWFTYEDLVDATNGFSARNLLGEGGFGSVYKGKLVDGRDVAVKKLKEGGGQGDREYRSEVEIISRVHHRHLVSLVGYCIFEETRLLVYDYLPNGTLFFHLHGQGTPVLDWATRVKIAVGAARGIAYLHEDCHPRIIHRDIKSSNILLDKNFEARVSDFGLAKLAVDANTHITTRVMGTFGYMAPEYASSGKLTEKSDVYSFGVVLLELISGRKSVDTSQPTGEESLVEWARPRLGHASDMEEFGGLPDPKLKGNYVPREMFRIIEAAAACIRHSSARRPTMGQVMRSLDSLSTSDLSNGMRVGESEILNPPLQSEVMRLFNKMAHGTPSHSTDSFSLFSQTLSKPENSAELPEINVERAIR